MLLTKRSLFCIVLTSLMQFSATNSVFAQFGWAKKGWDAVKDRTVATGKTAWHHTGGKAIDGEKNHGVKRVRRGAVDTYIIEPGGRGTVWRWNGLAGGGTLFYAVRFADGSSSKHARLKAWFRSNFRINPLKVYKSFQNEHIDDLTGSGRAHVPYGAGRSVLRVSNRTGKRIELSISSKELSLSNRPTAGGFWGRSGLNSQVNNGYKSKTPISRPRPRLVVRNGRYYLKVFRYGRWILIPYSRSKQPPYSPTLKR